MPKSKSKTNARSSSSSSSLRRTSSKKKKSKSKKSRKQSSLPSPVLQRQPSSSQSSSRDRAAATSTKTGDKLPSPNVVCNAINACVRRANKVQDKLQEAIELYPALEGDCDDEDSGSPITDLFVQESGPGVFKAMTPFTRLEFERIWDLISVPFISEYRNGRGRQPTTKAKDALFITLSCLKLPTTWSNVGSMFAMSAQRVEKLVWKVIEILAPLLKKDFVREVSLFPLYLFIYLKTLTMIIICYF